MALFERSEFSYFFRCDLPTPTTSDDFPRRRDGQRWVPSPGPTWLHRRRGRKCSLRHFKAATAAPITSPIASWIASSALPSAAVVLLLMSTKCFPWK